MASLHYKAVAAQTTKMDSCKIQQI